MTWTAYAGFDFAENSFSLGFNNGANRTGTITTGTYSHQAITASDVTYSLVATAIKSAMETADPGADTYTVALNTTTLRYTITRSPAASWTIISTGSNAFALGLLGIPSSALPLSSDGNGLLTGTICPTHLIRGQLGAASDNSGDYEVNDGVYVGILDDGATKGVHRATLTKCSDFTLQFETDDATFSNRATATVPWTWEDFFAHVRAEHAFLAVDGVYNTAHKLRADGAYFKPIRVKDDWDEYWHIRLLTYVEGRQ